MEIRKPGRPKIYLTEEARIEANKNNKTKYMLKKEWHCMYCGGKNYTLAGKWCHLKTEKYKKNAPKKLLKEINL